MGIAVRFTTAKGETPAIPDVTTTTAVIGETARASVVAKCIGIIITTAGTCSPAAIFGIRLANDINGALPEPITMARSEEHTSELQSRFDLVCRLLLEKK